MDDAEFKKSIREMRGFLDYALEALADGDVLTGVNAEVRMWLGFVRERISDTLKDRPECVACLATGRRRFRLADCPDPPVGSYYNPEFAQQQKEKGRRIDGIIATFEKENSEYDFRDGT